MLFCDVSNQIATSSPFLLFIPLNTRNILPLCNSFEPLIHIGFHLCLYVLVWLSFQSLNFLFIFSLNLFRNLRCNLFYAVLENSKICILILYLIIRLFELSDRFGLIIITVLILKIFFELFDFLRDSSIVKWIFFSLFISL